MSYLGLLILVCVVWTQVTCYSFKSLPKRIAFKSLTTGKYVTVNHNNEGLLMATSELLTPRESFQVIKMREVDLKNKCRSVIALRSLVNHKLVSVDGKTCRLKAISQRVGVEEKFIIYFGGENQASLRLMESLNFVSIEGGNNTRRHSPILTARTQSSDVFELIDLEKASNQDRVPKFISLKSVHYQQYIHVSNKIHERLRLSDRVIDESTIFQVYLVDNTNDDYYPAVNRSSRRTRVALKSIRTHRYVRSIQSSLYCDKNTIGNTEQFEIQYLSVPNHIVIRSTSSQKYVSSTGYSSSSVVVNATEMSDHLIFELVEILDRNVLPQKFFLQSVKTDRFIDRIADSSATIKASTKDIGQAELFNSYFFSGRNNLVGDNGTIISLRSETNNLYLGGNEKHWNSLVANRASIDTAEKFRVYFTSVDDEIGLKSTRTNRFVGIYSLQPARSVSINRHTFTSAEKFRVIESFDKSVLTKRFAIRSKANNRYLRVSGNVEDELKANGRYKTEYELFEAVFLSIPDYKYDIGASTDETVMLVALRSVATGRFLSVDLDHIYANSDFIGDNEKFELHFSSTHHMLIGLRSTKHKTYLTAYPESSGRLVMNRNHFKAWEQFYLIPL